MAMRGEKAAARSSQHIIDRDLSRHLPWLGNMLEV